MLCRGATPAKRYPDSRDANTELEQMIMYLETFKIVYYHLILNALYE